MKKTLLWTGCVLLIGCVSDPKRPDGQGVRASHDVPGKHCEQLEQVIGTSSTRSAAYDKALMDLKKETESRGGNYVRILTVSAHGAAIRGLAYRCR